MKLTNIIVINSLLRIMNCNKTQNHHDGNRMKANTAIQWYSSKELSGIVIARTACKS